MCVGWLFQIEDRILKSKLYAAKIPQKSTMLWVKFVVSSQWTAVRFSLWGLFDHRQWLQTRKAENINRWKKKVKLVADALEEDRRATCEELSKGTGTKISQLNVQEPTSVTRGWATHSPWQCSSSHRGSCNQGTWRLWVGSVTSCARHESTRRLIPKVERTYM